MLKLKIKKELKKFQKFKSNYKFNYKQLTKNEDGSLFIDNVCVKKGEDINLSPEDTNFINVAYNAKGSQLAKILSNLFPFKFVFRGYKVSSIESILQSLKFRDKKCQKLVLNYYGLNANRIKACSDYDWKENQTFYFMGKEMKRNSKEYSDFIDEIYISLLVCNPLFKNALKNVKEKNIVHAIGVEDKSQTTLSRYEFELELNCLKDYISK